MYCHFNEVTDYLEERFGLGFIPLKVKQVKFNFFSHRNFGHVLGFFVVGLLGHSNMCAEI